MPSGAKVTGPAGADTQIQYNNASAFGGSAGLTWDETNRALRVTLEYDAASHIYVPVRLVRSRNIASVSRAVAVTARANMHVPPAVTRASVPVALADFETQRFTYMSGVL